METAGNLSQHKAGQSHVPAVYGTQMLFTSLWATHPLLAPGRAVNGGLPADNVPLVDYYCPRCAAVNPQVMRLRLGCHLPLFFYKDRCQAILVGDPGGVELPNGKDDKSFHEDDE